MLTNLGEREWVAGYTFRGYVTGEHLVEVLLKTVDFISMTVHGDPVVQDYPTPEGRGGTGKLVYQGLAAPPVDVFISLHESGVMGNTYLWEDENGEVKAKVRVLLASCQKFPIYETGVFLKQNLGLPLVNRGSFEY